MLHNSKSSCDHELLLSYKCPDPSLGILKEKKKGKKNVDDCSEIESRTKRPKQNKYGHEFHQINIIQTVWLSNFTLIYWELCEIMNTEVLAYSSKWPFINVKLVNKHRL